MTARGSSFRVGADSELGDIGRLLGVRYCLFGTVEGSARRLAVTVELMDTHDGGIVWADRFSGRVDDVHSMRDEIRSRVLTALDIRIPLHEAALARLAVPDDLDAWSAYHLGLQHIYRFNRADNAAAEQLFQRAVALDPGFARAHAGLSFVHFQTAFMRYTQDTADQIRQARRSAERGLELDPLDPFVNFTMGRSYWLEGDLDSSLGWLERATSISPNYAQGIYARAWTETLAGAAAEGRRHVDLAMRLSPLDPLYYAMMATRAFTHMVLGEDTQAAHWAERGSALAGRPRADRDDRGRGPRPERRCRACRPLGRERSRAQPRARPRRLLPCLPDEARRGASAGVACADAARVLNPTTRRARASLRDGHLTRFVRAFARSTLRP